MAKSDKCTWTKAKYDLYFNTACGRVFRLAELEPCVIGYVFCPFCGRKIEVIND